MKSTRLFLATLAMTTALTTLSFAQSLTGAGSTFAAPLYTKWGNDAKPHGINLNYQAVGSGAGQAQIIARTVDFGASDAPMTTDKLGTNSLMQLPTAMGGVVPIVNLVGITNLRLTGDVLAEIYMGKITKWNDPKLGAINPTVTLPNLAIAPVYRADGSGTTFVFTSYLSKVNATFKSTSGASQSVKWPAGNGSRGNDGVAATVKQVNGSIGYVESAYAKGNATSVWLQNSDGNWVLPTTESFSAAVSNANWSVPNFAADLIQQPGPKTWPIVSPTFILVPLNGTPEKLAAIQKWLSISFSTAGDVATRNLDYIPLPEIVKKDVLAKLSKI